MAPDHTLDEQEPKHQRRVRYKGTHPKNFKEKYKELQPEQYADDVAKIIQKGNTPAGMGGTKGQVPCPIHCGDEPHRIICTTSLKPTVISFSNQYHYMLINFFTSNVGAGNDHNSSLDFFIEAPVLPQLVNVFIV